MKSPSQTESNYIKVRLIVFIFPMLVFFLPVSSYTLAADNWEVTVNNVKKENKTVMQIEMDSSRRVIETYLDATFEESNNADLTNELL